MHETPLSMDALRPWPDEARAEAFAQLARELRGFDKKIVVLDDDPTGTQTVHDVFVYTDWTQDTLIDAFRAPENLFYILTNSRGFSRERTAVEHRAIAHTIAEGRARDGEGLHRRQPQRFDVARPLSARDAGSAPRARGGNGCRLRRRNSQAVFSGRRPVHHRRRPLCGGGWRR